MSVEREPLTTLIEKCNVCGGRKDIHFLLPAGKTDNPDLENLLTVSRAQEVGPLEPCPACGGHGAILILELRQALAILGITPPGNYGYEHYHVVGVMNDGHHLVEKD